MADNLLLVPELTNALTDDAGEMARVRAWFAGCAKVSAADLDAVIQLQLRLAVSPQVDPDPLVGPVEAATEQVWRTLTPETAAAYARTLGPLIRQARADERRGTPASQSADEELPERFGPYVVDGLAGWGADGRAYVAHHQETGADAVVKYPAHGDGTVLARLGESFPAGLLRILGGDYDPGHPWAYEWVVREYADEVLRDVLEQRGPLPTAEALEVFRTCCETVAWLHEQQIYGWSAHPGNVFRVGDTWKIGDMGRCVAYVSPDHPAIAEVRGEFRERMPWLMTLPDDLVDWLVVIYCGCHPSRSGFWPRNDRREWRLRMDDCSMLGGLLCALLTGRRWTSFYKAVNTFPYCSATYQLTGDRHADRALSQVVNRCWRGDAGGALLVANDGRGEQTVYEDPLELLADVEATVPQLDGATVAGR